MNCVTVFWLVVGAVVVGCGSGALAAWYINTYDPWGPNGKWRK